MPAQGYRFNRSMQRCERSGKGGLPRGSPLQEGRRCASPRERPLTARLTDRFGSVAARYYGLVSPWGRAFQPPRCRINRPAPAQKLPCRPLNLGWQEVCAAVRILATHSCAPARYFPTAGSRAAARSILKHYWMSSSRDSGGRRFGRIRKGPSPTESRRLRTEGQ